MKLKSALVLAELLSAMTKDIQIDSSLVFGWTDYSAVIYWVNKSHNNLQLYMRNRVHQIHSLAQPSHWRYVRTVVNLVDLLSRDV